MVAPDTLPVGPVREGPAALAPGLRHSPSTTDHPRGGGIAFEREERFPEQIDVDVVEERGELLLLPLPCGLP